jgi:predicted TPR repeat methyltransferase
MSEASAVSTISPTREWKGRLRLPPKGERMPQDAEWCEIRENGGWHRVRFHDYGEIFERPGLYEHLFYDMLACQSPRRVVGLLGEVLADREAKAPLRAIDLGAGNGLVGRELRRIGAAEAIGVDILEEARAAAQRDLPGVYSDYLVADMTRADAEVDRRLRALRANALTCVAALGFGDIPPRAYHRAASYVAPGGLLAFNIKEEFLDARYTHGFSELMRRMVNEGVVRLEATRRYRHRWSATGEPIYYTAMVATKLEEIPESMLVEEEGQSLFDKAK